MMAARALAGVGTRSSVAAPFVRVAVESRFVTVGAFVLGRSERCRRPSPRPRGAKGEVESRRVRIGIRGESCLASGLVRMGEQRGGTGIVTPRRDGVLVFGLCCGQPATAQSESLRVEHHPQPTLTRTASLSLGDTPTRPLTLARNGGSAEQAYGGRETPKRVPTGVPLESLEGTQG